MNCIACAGDNTTQLNDGIIAPFVIARAELVNPDPRSCVCHDCGMRWCTHRLSETEATKLYADYRGPTYNAAREHHEPGYTAAHAHLNDTRTYLPQVEQMIADALGFTPATVLDIGGAGGTNTPFHATADVTVYDLDHAANRQHLAGRYDLIVLAHVLEHVAHPRHTINLARGMRAPGHGVIYAEVPIEQPRDFWHEHCQQFTRDALVALFDYKVLDYRELATNLGDVRMVVAR